MDARDVMTREVVTVTTDMSTRRIARLLLERGISAVPVQDALGRLVGMVSEGDLLRSGTGDARRDWWLELLAEGTTLAPDFLNLALDQDRPAKEVMSAPVITVHESTPVDEIARLLATHHIKRVPVLRGDELVGIVSRADLLRALASVPQAGHGGFLHLRAAAKPAPAPAPIAAPGVSAEDFRHLAENFDQHRHAQADAAKQIAQQQRRENVDRLLDEHVNDPAWQEILRKARTAAQAGETECLLLRFPSDLCSDGGRAINAPEPDWPRSLRGEAAEIYRRWESELRPQGFGLAAQILNFPDGLPGDVGLILTWG